MSETSAQPYQVAAANTALGLEGDKPIRPGEYRQMSTAAKAAFPIRSLTYRSTSYPSVFFDISLWY